jgi:DNA-binding response OmpR family regulator
MHLLVVDDEPRLLSLLERGLRAQGFEVQAAAGADEALSMARADPPTLAVTVSSCSRHCGEWYRASR